jgi:phosphoribosyl 1,2-cyclic phosphate phosphodiesterase
MHSMEVTLLGTGDTTGTPTVGCGCGTCETAREEGIERSRFSVHIRNRRTDESILVDFSPDFRAQFARQTVPLPDAGVITHIHFDHVDGLGNAYRLFERLPVYASSAPGMDGEPSVAATVTEKYAYLRPVEVIGVEPLVPQRVCGLEVTLVPVVHPPVQSYGVVIADPERDRRIAISGDTAYSIDAAAREAFRGADLFLADAIVPAALCERHPMGGADHTAGGTPRTFGTKHMTREGALALAEELEVGEVRLVHTAHYYPPDEAFASALAVDGEVHRI